MPSLHYPFTHAALSAPSRAGSVHARLISLLGGAEGTRCSQCSWLSMSHSVTVAWKPSVADTISRPRLSQLRVPLRSLALTRWPMGAGAMREEESFPAWLVSLKPCRRSWEGEQMASHPPPPPTRERNMASCSGRFVGSNPDIGFGKKAPRRGCSWNMGSLSHCLAERKHQQNPCANSSHQRSWARLPRAGPRISLFHSQPWETDGRGRHTHPPPPLSSAPDQLQTETSLPHPGARRGQRPYGPKPSY